MSYLPAVYSASRSVNSKKWMWEKVFFGMLPMACRSIFTPKTLLFCLSTWRTTLWENLTYLQYTQSGAISWPM